MLKKDMVTALEVLCELYSCHPFLEFHTVDLADMFLALSRLLMQIVLVV